MASSHPHGGRGGHSSSSNNLPTFQAPKQGAVGGGGGPGGLSPGAGGAGAGAGGAGAGGQKTSTSLYASRDVLSGPTSPLYQAVPVGPAGSISAPAGEYQSQRQLQGFQQPPQQPQPQQQLSAASPPGGGGGGGGGGTTGTVGSLSGKKKSDQLRREAEAEVVMGWLWKKGGKRRRNWKRRWHELRHGGEMFYFKGPKKAPGQQGGKEVKFKPRKPLGSFCVAGRTCSEVMTEKYDRLFQVITPTRTYLMRAEDDTDLYKWAQGLVMHGGNWDQELSRKTVLNAEDDLEVVEGLENLSLDEGGPQYGPVSQVRSLRDIEMAAKGPSNRTNRAPSNPFLQRQPVINPQGVAARGPGAGGGGPPGRPMHRRPTVLEQMVVRPPIMVGGSNPPILAPPNNTPASGSKIAALSSLSPPGSNPTSQRLGVVDGAMPVSFEEFQRQKSSNPSSTGTADGNPSEFSREYESGANLGIPDVIDDIDAVGGDISRYSAIAGGRVDNTSPSPIDQLISKSPFIRRPEDGDESSDSEISEDDESRSRTEFGTLSEIFESLPESDPISLDLPFMDEHSVDTDDPGKIPWFHADMTRSEARYVLIAAAPQNDPATGQYLLRSAVMDATGASKFVLSMSKCKAFGQHSAAFGSSGGFSIEHIVVSKDSSSGEWMFAGQPPDPRRFAKLGHINSHPALAGFSPVHSE